LGAYHVGCETGEAAHRGAGFTAGGGDPFDVANDPPVHGWGASGDEDELDPPGHFAVAFDMQATVGIGAQRAKLAGLHVEVGVGGPGEGVVDVLTTNWDDCIERGGGSERVSSIVTEHDLLHVAPKAVLKIH
jgi:hypothetical protein